MNKSIITEEVAAVAAKWWRDAVANGKWDNGDPFQNAFVAVLGSDLRGNDSETLDRFESILKNMIILSQETTFSVDYHPDQILEDAAKAAGFKSISFAFPCKTRMYISNGVITASLGYRAPRVYIYGLETAQRDWDNHFQGWVQDADGIRTQVLGEKWYEKYREMKPEESFVALYGNRPFNEE